jgi:CubicO group peptidase (beta-lactamase class C family)
VTLARGYGVRRLGEDAPVDADTIFQLGSVGKAFTTAALAVLYDRGQIDWDDPVTKHIPWFQMYDPWVTREMKVVDLLVHRSGLGLGAGDLMFVPRSNLSRAETVRRVRYLAGDELPQRLRLRQRAHAAAGQLIEEVTGKTWERFVREEVLAPAGMRTATSDRVDRRKTANRAWPHARLDGPMHGMGTQKALDDSGQGEFDPELGQNAAPAGAVAASANDMARWMLIQLARGALPGGSGRLFSEASARQMWMPRVPLPISPSPGPTAAATPQFNAYALGWSERDYRGVRLMTHTGAVFGAQAIIILIPEREVGFSVAINCEDGEAALGIAYELLDHYLDRPRYDWGAAWQQVVKERDEKAVKLLKEQTAAPAKVGPSLPLERYAGEYADAWYGPIAIAQHDGRLTIDFKQTPGMTGELTHWQYDTFKAEWRDPLIEPAYVTFALGADGGIDRIGLRAVSPLADFSFDYQDLDFRPAARK